jgi:hypothetical protein
LIFIAGRYYNMVQEQAMFRISALGRRRGKRAVGSWDLRDAKGRLLIPKQ